MKTAISIPDELFEEADRLAAARGMSRSELYSTAISEYLKAQRGVGVRERLDAVYAITPDRDVDERSSQPSMKLAPGPAIEPMFEQLQEQAIESHARPTRAVTRPARQPAARVRPKMQRSSS